MSRLMPVKALCSLMLLLAFACSAQVQAAAVDCYIEIEGMDESGGGGGAGKREKEKDSEVKGFLLRATSFDSANTAAHGAGGGGGAGKVQIADLKAEFDNNEVTPQLFLKHAVGEHIKKATITYYSTKDGQKPVKYFQIVLEDVLISSFSFAQNDHEAPSTQIALNFAKITLQQFKSDGSAQGPKVGWDVKSNKKA